MSLLAPFRGTTFEDLVRENAVEIALRINSEKALRALRRGTAFDSPRVLLTQRILEAAEVLAHFEELQDIWSIATWDDLTFEIAEDIASGEPAKVHAHLHAHRDKRIAAKAKELERQLVQKLSQKTEPRKPARTRRR